MFMFTSVSVISVIKGWIWVHIGSLTLTLLVPLSVSPIVRLVIKCNREYTAEATKISQKSQERHPTDNTQNCAGTQLMYSEWNYVILLLAVHNTDATNTAVMCDIGIYGAALYPQIHSDFFPIRRRLDDERRMSGLGSPGGHASRYLGQRRHWLCSSINCASV